MEETTTYAITISRQLGSGASLIGQYLAKELGIFYADREIIRKTAQKLSMPEDNLEQREETLLSFWNSFFHINGYTAETHIPPEMNFPFDHELFDAESEVIKRIADERSAVIIGRCGFHALREHPNCINIFLHADTKFRNERVQQLFNVPEAEAEKMIVRSDKDREAYCKTFTGKKWGDTQNYDLTIDTSKVGVENAAKLILKYINLRRTQV